MKTKISPNWASSATGKNEPIKKKKIKEPPQADQRGTPVMVVGPSGKTRMAWLKNGKVTG